MKRLFTILQLVYLHLCSIQQIIVDDTKCIYTIHDIVIEWVSYAAFTLDLIILSCCPFPLLLVEYNMQKWMKCLEQTQKRSNNGHYSHKHRYIGHYILIYKYYAWISRYALRLYILSAHSIYRSFQFQCAFFSCDFIMSHLRCYV